jgi:hypothetical protein
MEMKVFIEALLEKLSKVECIEAVSAMLRFPH